MAGPSSDHRGDHCTAGVPTALHPGSLHCAHGVSSGCAWGWQHACLPVSCRSHPARHRAPAQSCVSPMSEEREIRGRARVSNGGLGGRLRRSDSRPHNVALATGFPTQLPLPLLPAHPPPVFVFLLASAQFLLSSLAYLSRNEVRGLLWTFWQESEGGGGDSGGPWLPGSHLRQNLKTVGGDPGSASSTSFCRPQLVLSPDLVPLRSMFCGAPSAAAAHRPLRSDPEFLLCLEVAVHVTRSF